MPIICFPDDMKPRKITVCVLCGEPTTLQNATVGLLYADGSQAFAHSAHMQGRTEWFVGWALFIAAERRKLLEQGNMPRHQDEMGLN